MRKTVRREGDKCAVQEVKLISVQKIKFAACDVT